MQQRLVRSTLLSGALWNTDGHGAISEAYCLFYSYFRGGSEWQFDGPAGAVRFQPKGNYQVNNSEALREALMPDYRLPEHAIYAVYPQRKYLPAKVSAFVDFLLAQLGGERPYWDTPDR